MFSKSTKSAALGALIATGITQVYNAHYTDNTTTFDIKAEMIGGAIMHAPAIISSGQHCKIEFIANSATPVTIKCEPKNH